MHNDSEGYFHKVKCVLCMPGKYGKYISAGLLQSVHHCVSQSVSLSVLFSISLSMGQSVDQSVSQQLLS